MKQRRAPVIAEPSEERTLFVRGTFSGGEDKDYFDDEMMKTSSTYFGAGKQEEFDWFGGPNHGLSRRIAGRKLLLERILPSFESGETVDVIAHSHGGNVVAEMARAFEERLDYLAALTQGGEVAEEALDNREKQLNDELRQLGGENKRDDRAGAARGPRSKRRGGGRPWRKQQVAQLHVELDELERHRTWVKNEEFHDFHAQYNILNGGNLDDVMNLNTPYFEKHGDIEDDTFLNRLGNFYDVVNPNDPVVRIANLAERITGGKPYKVDAEAENASSVPWVLEKDERAWGPNLPITPRGLQEHSYLTNSADAFEEKVIDPLNKAGASE